MFARKDLKLLNEINGMFWQVSPDWTKRFTYVWEGHFAVVIGYQNFLGGFSNEENSE